MCDPEISRFQQAGSGLSVVPPMLFVSKSQNCGNDVMTQLSVCATPVTMAQTTNIHICSNFFIMTVDFWLLAFCFLP
jgi:hypothetical protein